MQTGRIHLWPQLSIEFDTSPLTYQPDGTTTNYAETISSYLDFMDQLIGEPFIEVNLMKIENIRMTKEEEREKAFCRTSSYKLNETRPAAL